MVPVVRPAGAVDVPGVRVTVMKRVDALRGRLAGALYALAYRLEPPERGVPCRDCGAPRPPGEEDCPVCRAGWEEQKRDRGLYDEGYVDGYSEATMRSQE